MNTRENFEKWLNYDKLEESLKKELLEIKDDENEINERFSTALSFGTAGLRGIIRAGTNGMNIYTVRQATQGLANLIKKNGKDAMNAGVAIAYDSRICSDTFSIEAAKVLAGNGIKVFLFESLRPTPMLSFAIRYLKTTAGIVVTASHNPAKYNGYKAYWSDGAQLPPEESQIVFEEMQKVDIFDGVVSMDYDKAVSEGIIKIISKEVDEPYYEYIMSLSINPDALKNTDLKVVYTPFHGAGNIPVRTVLDRMGLKNVTVVKEQELPDGRFPTVKSPNPEDSEGFVIAREYAKKVDADIIVGTDPDSDRVGLLLKNSSGEYEILNGNQIGIVLVNYVLEGLKKNNNIPENGVIIKSIVTTNMINEIAKAYNVKVMNVLTGFKYIGEKIKQFEADKSHTYLFGFEESFGYLSGTKARDKDAVNASMLICEAAAFYKKQGKTLKQVLDSIYEKYSYYTEKTISVTYEGLSGIQKIKDMMANLVKNPPKEFAGVKVLYVNDYLNSVRTNAQTNETEPFDFEKSNVLSYDLEDGTLLTIRPSGTEPKIKAYVMTKGKTQAQAEENKEKYTNAIRKLI